MLDLINHMKVTGTKDSYRWLFEEMTREKTLKRQEVTLFLGEKLYSITYSKQVDTFLVAFWSFQEEWKQVLEAIL